jgi:hypothetical protein
MFPTPPLPTESFRGYAFMLATKNHIKQGGRTIRAARAASCLRMSDLSYLACSASVLDDDSLGRAPIVPPDEERTFPAPPRPVEMI